MNNEEQPIELSSLEGVELAITVAPKPITLPAELQKDIDEHWRGMITKRPNLFNGITFSVVCVDRTPAKLAVTMAQTNFAHNTYSEEHDAGEHAYRVLHSATLVVTSDNQFIFGEMGQLTARTGAICCSGGSIDENDVHDGVVDLTGNTARELLEELGIDANNPAQVTTFTPLYLKTGGPKGKITAVYRADLAIAAREFQKVYDTFVMELTAQSETPEFSRLFFVRNTPEDIAVFLAAHSTFDEYVAPVLRAISATK